MQRTLIVLLSTFILPTLTAGCVAPFDPDPWCPRPLDECNWGYLSSTAVNQFEGKWNATSFETVMVNHGIGCTQSYFGDTPGNPTLLANGSYEYAVASGFSLDSKTRTATCSIKILNYTGNDTRYAITMNMTYQVEHLRTHYLPYELAEQDRDRHLNITTPFHQSLVRALTETLDWTPTNGTQWDSLIGEKPDYIREYHERPWWKRLPRRMT